MNMKLFGNYAQIPLRQHLGAAVLKRQGQLFILMQKSKKK